MRVACLAGLDGSFSRRLLDILSVVERIIVAGGAGADVLQRLDALAPVTAVVGTKDYCALGHRLPETAEVELAGARVLVTQMVGSAPDFLPPLRRRLAVAPPDVVVHGESGKPGVGWHLGTLLLCPGTAQSGRAGWPATCGVLEIEGPGRITAHIFDV